MAQSAPSIPDIPSAKTIRRRLQSSVEERQQNILQKLPDSAKVSIALDCWTSPFNQAFMAISCYFIDDDWHYQEVLLGFEPLHGKHSGANLSTVLLAILEKHKILDRIFAVTTDNASNNNTLVSELQKSLSDSTTLIRIPCLAHVIQLSLNDLLCHMKATPTDDTSDTPWVDKRSQSARVNSKKPDITTTLSKIRSLAVFVNASPQRRDTFYSLQTTATKILPIRDVKTRWNSTFLMLRRTKRLRAIFIPFCAEWERPDLLLNDEEWRQVDYLIWITHPFYEFTTELSKTKDVTSHHVFKIYNLLFEHLESSIAQLKKKNVPWKKNMLQALEAGRKKLDYYYSMTDAVPGDLYAVSTMLAPENKFKFFQTKDWDDEWRARYRKSFKESLTPYVDRFTTQQSPPISQPSHKSGSRLGLLLKKGKHQPAKPKDEFTEYLDSDIVDSSPLDFWRVHQQRFPAIAALVRDVLSVPATGAGVERLFNIARDICHYRRGRLHAATIQELMMFLCVSKFEIDQEQYFFISDFLSQDEIESAKEEKEERPDEFELEPISDNEEQGTEEEGREEDGDDFEDEASPHPVVDVSLPVVEERTTQVRQSVRSRKRPRQEDDQYIYH